MDFKKYLSDKKTVTVSVAKLENQKITKSIFSQIPETRRIRYPFDFEGIQMLGFVNEKSRWLIYTSDDVLYKCSISHFYKVVQGPITSFYYLDIQKYVKTENYPEFDDFDTFNMLPVEMQNEFRAAVDNIRLFLTTLRKHQIYI